MFNEDGSGTPAPSSDTSVQLAQAPGEPIGTVEELAGSVTLTRADGSSAAAAPGDPVYLNDVVTTATGSSVEIRFVDGTRFSLGQDGEMTLDQLVYNPGGGGNELDLSVVQGAFTFVTGAIAGAPGDGMEVRVPVGTIGIRGTAVGGGPDSATADPTDYTIVLLPEPGGAGRIVLTDLTGRSVILDDALEGIDISSLGLAAGEPVQLTREEVIDLLGGAVENIEDILDAILNFESPEEENPEAGEQEGEAVPTTPNTGGINEQRGETQSLDEITTLVTLSNQAGFSGGFEENGPLGGSIGNTTGQNGQQGGPPGSDGPTDTTDPSIIDQEPTRTVITGGPGDDDLSPGEIAGPVEIIGLDGNDLLTGGEGDDILTGGEGDDTLDAGAGNDQVFGNGGNDLLIGGSGEGNDHLDGGAGIDTVQYSSATLPVNVNLTAGTASGDPAIGSDTLVDVENVIGGQGGDFIIGDEAGNVLDGGEGDDELSGFAGDDTLIGGFGDDTMTGGAGNDALQGGSGTDIAFFSGNAEDYVIDVGAEGGITVTDLRADGDGTDTLSGVEFLSFADQTIPSGVPVPGEQFAFNGAAMKTTVTEVAAGAVLTLKFNFLDSEPLGQEPSFKDYAVVFINGEAFKLADVDGATSPIGTTSVSFDDQTGYGTFSFTFTEAGNYSLGIAVLNEGDSSFNAGLLIDDVSITGDSFSDGFEAEAGLEEWDAVGDVTVVSNYGDVPPPEGEFQALLVSTPATPEEIEAFLGVPPGTLDQVANQAVAVEHVDYDDTNQQPVATDDFNDDSGYGYVTDEDDPISFSQEELWGNDEDPDGDPLSITGFTGAEGGEVGFDIEGQIVFMPDADYNGPASFTYIVDDGNGGTDTATVHLTVEPVNDVPGPISDTDDANNSVDRSAQHGTSVGIKALSIDLDASDEVTYSLSGSADGIFAIDATTGVVTVGNPTLLRAFTGSSLSITIVATDLAGLEREVSLDIAVTNDSGIIFGTPGNDPALQGTSSDDHIVALAGIDLVVGLSGNDTIEGDDGADSLFGDSGNDTLEGGGGNDLLSGGQGDDVLDGGEDIDTISYSGTASGIVVDLETGQVSTDGEGGTDTLISVENVVGSGQSDSISGNEDANALVGGDGDDQLFGLAEDDVLVPGQGYDFVDGGDHDDFGDTISFADAENDIYVDLAEHIAFGGDGKNDEIVNVENVIGSGSDDQIHGDSGANIITGGGGVDIIHGRGGDDVLIFEDQEQLDSNEVVDGGEGIDTLLIAGESASIDLSLVGSVSSIERIDASGNGANSIALSADDVIRLSGELEFDEDTGAPVDLMTILGDADDTVNLNGGGWEQQAGDPVDVGGTFFNIYLSEGVKLYVEAEITTQNIVNLGA